MADGVSGNSPVNQSAFATTVQDRIRILETYKRIAMVGLSSIPSVPAILPRFICSRMDTTLRR